MGTYSYEDIAAKAEWEGGFDEALDWFKPNEVPSEIALHWESAQVAKRAFNEALDHLIDKFPEELQ